MGAVGPAMRAGLAVLLLAAVARAALLAWTCDDAFVSLRYAENLLAGHGLVYNPGERVEGYTNFLWTLLLAALRGVGVPALPATQLPGLVAYALLIALLLRETSRRRGAPFLPLAAGCVLVSDDFHVWATGGLETMLFTLLAAESLLAARRAGEGGRGRTAWAGCALALLALTRPDGVLFAPPAVLACWVAAPPPRRVRRSLALLAPLAITLALWLGWKLAYYGELLPTAFYSKSAARPWLEQGLVYAGLFLAKNYYLVLAALAAVLAQRCARGNAARPDLSLPFAAGAFAAYLVWVGGDFMFARRLLPVVPLLLLAVEERLVRLPRPVLARGLAAICVVAAALPYPVFGDRLRIAGIADERRFHPPEAIASRALQARGVAEALEGIPARVAFEGGMCMFGYYSELPYLVELTGLTQYSLARLPLESRGVVGHEKVATPEWLEQHGVHFVVQQDYPPVARASGPRDPMQVFFGDHTRAQLVYYDDALMDPLRARDDVDFVPIEEVVAASLEAMQAAPPAQARQIHADLRSFYFDRAGPRGRALEAPLLDLLSGKQRN